MKYSFALAAIFAIASAQESAVSYDDYVYYNETIPEPEPTLAEKLFELNEDGQFQLVWPKNPSISVTDADDAAIKEWFDGKMAEATALDMEFLEAYKTYESAVHQPYNDFLTQVEELTVRGIQMDAKTDQEIVEFMANNTFINGESLKDKYPQIEDVLTGIQAQADMMSEHFSLDGLRATPTALYYQHHTLQSYDDGYYYINDSGECVYYSSYYGESAAELSDCGIEPESNPVKDAIQGQIQKDMEQAKDNLMSYGFDPNVVNAWFQDKSQSFEELQKQQDMESAQKAQADIREAADYLKGIADKWIADMPRQHDEEMAKLGEKFQGIVDNMKTKLDEQAASDIAAIDAWVNDTYDQIVAATEAQVDVDPFDEPVIEPAITLAKKIEGRNTREHYAYGFAAASVGFAAMGAYIYLSKKQQKVSTEKKQTLLDADVEFQMV